LGYRLKPGEPDFTQLALLDSQHGGDRSLCTATPTNVTQRNLRGGQKACTAIGAGGRTRLGQSHWWHQPLIRAGRRIS
jgi:hypothetical protein